MENAIYVTTIGGILSLGVWVWYFTSLGKLIHVEEKQPKKI